MSTRLEYDLASRDTQLPGLATLLDPGAFSALLSRMSGRRTRREARIAYVRYKPGRRCLVAYRFQQEGHADVYAQALTSGGWQKYHDRYGCGLPSEDGARPAPMVCDELRIIVFPFPCDRQLPVIARLSDNEGRFLLLRKLLPHQAALWPATLEPLAYKPERRFVAGLHCQDEPVAVLKCYTPIAFAKARDNTKALRSGEVLRLAEARGRSRRTCSLVLDWLPGRLLQDLILSDRVPGDALIRVGQALAELHAQRGRRLEARSRCNEATTLRDLADVVGFLAPPLADQVSRLAGRLARWLGDLPTMNRPIHGDFYSKQVVLDRQRVGLIDLDEAVRGDPAMDLSNLLAHLERYALRDGLPRDHVEQAADALLHGYAAQTGDAALDRVRLYTAACLLRLAPHPFRHAEPDWVANTAAIIDRVAEIAHQRFSPLAKHEPGGLSGEVSRGNREAAKLQDRFGVLADAKFSFLRAALDPVRAAPLLHAAAGRNDSDRSASLREIRVARYKPGRRCLIEYDFEEVAATSTTGVLIGKVRAKGVNRAAYELQRRLFQGNFNQGAKDGYCVPEPLGCIPAWNMWLQRKIEGRLASRLWLDPQAAQYASRTAEAIYKLHQSECLTTRSHTIDDELEILADRLRRVAHQRPSWRNRLYDLMETYRSIVKRLPCNPERGIHRDFYPDQVLIAGSRLYLLDLDLYARGDPALDVGNFSGHLIEQGLRDAGDPAHLAGMQQAFEGRYLQLAGMGMREAIDIYTLLTLGRHIYLSTQFADRHHTTLALLDLCEGRLGLLCR